MLCVEHGVYPREEMVPLTTLRRSPKGNLWGALTETVRVFVFPGIQGLKKARLAFMSREDVTFTILCELDEEGDEGWTGMIGLGWIKVRKNPDWKGKASWSLCVSPWRKTRPADPT